MTIATIEVLVTKESIELLISRETNLTWLLIIGIRSEHDPFRSANIMLVEYEDKTIAYMLAPEGVKIGDKIYSGEKLEILPGNCMKIKDMPGGTKCSQY